MTTKLKETIYDIKNKPWLQLYIITIFVLNAVYLYLEVHKSNYLSNVPLINGNIMEISKYVDIEYIDRLNSIIDFIFSAFNLVMVAYVLFIAYNYIKKRYLGDLIRNFFVINIFLITLVLVAGYLLSIIYSAPIGNLIIQLVVPVSLSLPVLIYSLFSYK